MSTSGATFKSVDRFGGGQVRGMQQVQALRWKSTSDMNKGTPDRAEGPSDEFLCQVNCFPAHVRIKIYMIDQFETREQRSGKRNRRKNNKNYF